MADFNSSLPVRTEGDADEKVQVKIADASTPSQQASVSASGELSVLAHGDDAGTERPLNVDSSGDLQVDVLSLNDGGNVISIDDAAGSLTVDATQLDIDDLAPASDGVAVYGTDDGGTTQRQLKTLADGTLVVDVDASVGDEVHNYTTTATVAKDASVNHDYTVTVGKTLHIKQVLVSASGRTRTELIIDPAGSPATVFVGWTSASNPQLDIPLSVQYEVAAATVVRLTIKNTDNQTMDVYSTLIGSEL